MRKVHPLLLSLAPPFCTHTWRNCLWCHKGWKHPPFFLPDCRRTSVSSSLTLLDTQVHSVPRCLFQRSGDTDACKQNCHSARGSWQIQSKDSPVGKLQPLLKGCASDTPSAPQLYTYWGVLLLQAQTCSNATKTPAGGHEGKKKIHYI